MLLSTLETPNQITFISLTHEIFEQYVNVLSKLGKGTLVIF